MRLLFKLSLTIASLLLMLALVYLSMPGLIKLYFHYQLSQQGFDHIEITIDSVDTQSISLSRLQMSNHGMTVDIAQIRAGYTLEGLLNGALETINIQRIDIVKRPTQGAKILLPDPASLLLELTKPWHEMLPVRQLNISVLTVMDELDGVIAHASGEIRRSRQHIIGEFKIRDALDRHAHFGLKVSQSAIDLQFAIDWKIR